MNDDVIMRTPPSYEPLTAEELRNALTTNACSAADYLCDNPWSVIDGDDDVETRISLDGDALSEIIMKAIREAIQEENSLVTPEIEKYHIKHR